MNPRVAEISTSLIREIAAKRKPTSVDLGLGEPSLRPNPAHLDAAMAYVREHGIRYTLNAGDADLRARIAEHYAYPHMNAAENVCITTGSQEAMYAAIKALLDPAHDELLVVEPAFPSYAKMAALEGIAVRAVAMREEDGFAFDAERIVTALGPATRAIVICSPCNPTARVLTREAVQRLSDALLRRGGEPVWVIHDEVYREQTFIENAGYFAQVYPYTIVTNSISKSNALTGLRLGWALTPRELSPSIVKVHAWVTSCTDTFAQRVALSIFNDPRGVGEHAAWYAQRQAAVVEVLRASGLRFIVPEGSFYACVAIPGGGQSRKVAHELADTRDVIAVPGIAFGASFDGWLRLSWVSPVDQLREGVERLAAHFAEFGTAQHQL